MDIEKISIKTMTQLTQTTNMFFSEKLFYKDHIEPEWLNKYANEEEAIFRKIIQNKKFSGEITNNNILDIGCGNCRIYREIPETSSYERHGADAYEKDKLPLSFVEWIDLNKISYSQVQIKESRLNLIDLGKFDIITCWGLDSFLETGPCRFYLDSLKSMLKPDGILIWHANRKDTIQAMKFKIQSSLKYEFKNLKLYDGSIGVYYTDISRVYVFNRDISRIYISSKGIQ